jgi:tetraacyldisaccharide 4'-kinase
MFLRRLFLFPFAVLYNALTRIRNHMFDLKLKPSASFDIPIVSVGNLSVGGTGKTPMVEYLIRLLGNRYKLATLSRGYGRTTKGMRIANALDTADTVGDEPFQIYQKFKANVIVSVCEERAFAIPYLMDQFPELKVILLDDAFQHRFVKPGFSLLLTEYSHPFYHDFLLPAGNLREARKGAKRADIVVVTKCPHYLPEEEMMEIEHNIRKYTNNPVFFCKIRYGTPLSFTEEKTLETKKVVLVSAIANPESFHNYVKQHFDIVKHLTFRDHHAYTDSEISNIIHLANKFDAVVLATQKDKVKLEKPMSRLNFLKGYALPIEFEFLKDGSDFDALLLEFASRASLSVND